MGRMHYDNKKSTTINDTAEFYQSKGGKIIIGDLWEGCTMIIKNQLP